VLSKDFDPTPQAVYNLEVGQWHNFLVGVSGVVAHNTGCTVLEFIDDAIANLKKQSIFIEEGTGTYNAVKGHHPLSKIAFEGASGYPTGGTTAFSVSSATLDKVSGLSGTHYAISGKQKTLYTNWVKANPNTKLTIDKMAEIEVKAMTSSGINEQIAKGWVTKALEDIKAKGVSEINKIPHVGPN
jgi:hypothetical protein